MALYLDPKIDLVFKKIFGEHPHLTISFLNALMPLSPGQLIESIEYIPAEQVPANPLKKNSIVDVRCKDNYGRFFIVEMQVSMTNGFSSRMVFNTAKTYVNQARAGDMYAALKPVYGLAILNHVFDHETDRFYHHYEILNREKNNAKLNDMEFIFVELPKFKPESMTDKKMAVLWLKFLKEIKDSKILPYKISDDPYIREAAELCMEAALSDEERAHYDGELDSIRIENGRIYMDALREAKDVELAKKETEIQHKETEIQHKETEIQHKETEIQHKETEIQHKETEIQHKETEIQHKETEIQHKETEIQHKETELARKETELAQRETELTKQIEELARKVAALAEKEKQRNQFL
jgi:predicted transposase/invertase (TIGR01784 family)